MTRSWLRRKGDYFSEDNTTVLLKKAALFTNSDSGKLLLASMCSLLVDEIKTALKKKKERKTVAENTQRV